MTSAQSHVFSSATGISATPCCPVWRFLGLTKHFGLSSYLQPARKYFHARFQPEAGWLHLVLSVTSVPDSSNVLYSLPPPRASLTPLSGFETWLELREQLMDCEMFPMLQQQQELMSQSPSETTQAARNSDSGPKIKAEASVPGYLWCVREAISVSLIVVKLSVRPWRNCNCLLKWIWPHSTGFPFFYNVTQDPEFSSPQFWHL